MTNKTMKPIEQIAVDVCGLAKEANAIEIDYTGGYKSDWQFTPENLLKFAELYFQARCAELSEPYGFVTNDSFGTTIYKTISSVKTQLFCNELYLSPQPSQDADYVKGLEDALNEIIVNDDSAYYVCEKIARKALANKPSQEDAE